MSAVLGSNVPVGRLLRIRIALRRRGRLLRFPSRDDVTPPLRRRKQKFIHRAEEFPALDTCQFRKFNQNQSHFFLFNTLHDVGL
ncbi:hypothetical protein [Burkholderia multivorans]|uniref:hypothetical protein n=1 Tax=Burkholderia multivorans TaxID=87883 RepID=UPI0011B2019C|nr:hypothetical protein [Burkholderia multivorans]